MRVLSFEINHTPIVIKVDDERKSGQIATSSLRCPCPMDSGDEAYNTGVDALETAMLQHAIAGVNVNTPHYLQGIEIAVQALDRQYL